MANGSASSPPSDPDFNAVGNGGDFATESGRVVRVPGSGQLPAGSPMMVAPPPVTVPIESEYGRPELLFYQDRAAYNALAKGLASAGFKNDPSDLGSVESAWKRALNGASFYSDRFTPYEYLNALAAGKPGVYGDVDPPSGGSGGSGGAFSSHSVNRQVNITDPSSARKFVDDALGQYLGRSATAGESAAFLKALNGLELDNPTVTESSTSGYSSGGSSSSTSSTATTGGLDRVQVAEDFAKSREGFAERAQATMADWLADSLTKKDWLA